MKRALTLIFTLAFLLISFKSFTYKYGPGGGYTNAPGEKNCATSGCHTGTSLNGGNGSLTNMVLSDNFSGGGYIPDSTYTFKLSYKQSKIDKWGFSMTALRASDNSPAGKFAKTDSRTQTKTRWVSSNTRYYIEQTSSGITSTGTNAVDWVFKWTAPSTNVGKIKLYTALNAADGNNSQSGDEIYAKVFEIEPSSLLPVARPTAKSKTVCTGETVYLYGSGTNSPTTYEWTIPDGTPSSSAKQHPTVTFSSTGKKQAILRVKNAKGWSDYDTLTIDVIGSVTAQILGYDNRTMCPNDSVELIAAYNPNYSYLWSTGETAGNRIYAKKGGDYYVEVSLKSGGCSQKSNVVKIKELSTTNPAIMSSASSDTVCRFDNITLTSSTGFDSLRWYDGSNWVGSSVGNKYVVSYDKGSMYRAKGWNSNGCLSDYSNSIMHTVIEAPNGPVVNCVEQKPYSLSFEWSLSKGSMGVEVSEDKGKTWKAPDSGTLGEKHQMTGLYPEQEYELWLREGTTFPCYYSKVSKAVCKTGKCSPLDVFVMFDTMVCAGNKVNVEISGLNGEAYSISLDSGMAFTDTSFTIHAGVSHKYLLEITDSAFLGCPPKRFELPVQVDSIPSLQIGTDVPDNTYCQGDTLRLNATGGNEKYAFYLNTKLRGESSDSLYSETQFSDGDSAYVIARKGACVATSDPIEVRIAVPHAGYSFKRNGSMYTFTPDSTGYPSYAWDFGDGGSSAIANPQHDFINSANATVSVGLEVRDKYNCLSSDVQDIDLPNFNAVEGLESMGMKVYPSPVGQTLYLELGGQMDDKTEVSMYNLLGKEILKLYGEGDQLSIDVSELTPGTYLLKVKTGEVLMHTRVVKN